MHTHEKTSNFQTIHQNQFTFRRKHAPVHTFILVVGTLFICIWTCVMFTNAAISHRHLTVRVSFASQLSLGQAGVKLCLHPFLQDFHLQNTIQDANIEKQRGETQIQTLTQNMMWDLMKRTKRLMRSMASWSLLGSPPSSCDCCRDSAPKLLSNRARKRLRTTRLPMIIVSRKYGMQT